jgi:anti-sigma B factor antagonist
MDESGAVAAPDRGGGSMEAGMDLRFVERDGVLFARVAANELGADTAEEFRRNLLAGIDGHAWVVLDLTPVTFMDSSGLGVLVAAMKALRGRGELRLTGVDARIQELFSLTGLNRVFQVEPDERAAVAGLQAARRRKEAA